MSEEEKLPKINKVAYLIGHPFRIVSEKGRETLKTNYDYWMKHKTHLFFRENEGEFERYDKDNKQWISDNKANYWYTEEKTNKRKSFISVSTEYIIEFKNPTNIEVWAGQKITKKVIKCSVEFSGNQSFGQVKTIFDRLTEYEAMGKKRTGTFVEMYKDGIRYNFKYNSDYTPEEGNIGDLMDNKPETTTPTPTPSTLPKPVDSDNIAKAKDSIDALKMDEYKHYTKSEIKTILTNPANGINLTMDEANSVITSEFSERGE